MDKGGTLRLASFAPARVNLIGEHVDYLGGCVVPAAVSLGCTTNISATRLAPSTRPIGGSVFHFSSTSVASNVEYDFSADDVEVPAKGKSFNTMCYGAIQEAWSLAAKLGTPLGARIEVSISSDVPIGAGLSSSAALLVSIISGLVTVFLGVSSPQHYYTPAVRTQVALAARAVENSYCGVQVGIMDQYASVHGAPNMVMKVDCGALTHERVALPSSLGIVLLDSMRTHELLGQYNAIRSDLEVAEKALSQLLNSPSVTLASVAGRTFLMDGVENSAAQCFALLHQNGVLTKSQANRGIYAVEEMERVERFVSAADGYAKGGTYPIGGEDTFLRELGAIVFAGHVGLSDQLGVSTPELDALVSLCRAHPEAVYGARMMGGGFGGCAIALVNPTLFTPEVQANIQDGFRRAFPDITSPCRIHNVCIDMGSHVTIL